MASLNFRRWLTTLLRYSNHIGSINWVQGNILGRVEKYFKHTFKFNEKT